MASIITNGVVREVPYAIIDTVSKTRPWTLSVVGRDLRASAYNQQQLRTLPAGDGGEAKNGIFVYVGDVITLTLRAPCNSVSAPAFNLNQVNFTTGAVTLAATVGFNLTWQKQAVVTITAISATTGAVTFTTALS